MSNQDESLRRKLKGWQIYFIAIGGIIGIGFFTNAGQVLAIAGPGGTVLAFFVVGMVATFVMEGICEMIVLWPIPNAMVEFVRIFVDEDLAAAVGVGYCYTYTITFSALIVSAANLATYWGISAGLKSLIFAITPICLVILNLLWVEIYGWVEAIGGAVKMGFVVFVFILMILVNRGVIGDEVIGTSNWNQFIQTNTAVANSKAEAILIAIPQVTFAYIGVELLTTTAYEAQDAGQLKRTAMFIAPQVCLIYLAVSTVFVSNVPWNNTSLPQLFGQTSQQSSTGFQDDTTTSQTTNPPTDALPVIALLETHSPHLASVLTAVLIYSGLSAANTALYVASRTLYGLARNFKVTDQSSWPRKGIHGISAILTWTGAPLWGVVIPAVILYWLPFIHLDEDSTKELLQEILLNIGSVSAVLVWFSQCLAYISFWRLRNQFKHRIEISNDDRIRRLLVNTGRNSMLASGQPFIAILGAIGTFTIVFVLNSAVLWNGKDLKIKFFSTFLSPIVMGLVFLILKIKRTRFFTSQNVKYWGIEMDEYTQFERAIRHLNGMINPATQRARKSRSFSNLLGFGRNEPVVRVSPASTTSENRVAEYRPGNFTRIDAVGTNDNPHPQHATAPVPVIAQPQPLPRVHIDNEYEMDDFQSQSDQSRLFSDRTWREV